MPVKVININLDEDEYRYSLAKKGERVWKRVFLDGLEWKAWEGIKKPKR